MLSRVLPIAILAGCTQQPEPPAELPWPVHALSMTDSRTLAVVGPGDTTLDDGTVREVTSVATEDPNAATSESVGAGVPLSTAVAAGKTHACVISSMQVHCWGDQANGALGAHRRCMPPATEGGVENCALGAAVMPTLPPVKAIDAGSDVTCAIAFDDRVYCWGSDALGSNGGSIVPALDEPRPVMTGEVALVAARLKIWGSTVCAIDFAGTAWCWGDGFGDRPIRQLYTDVLDLALGTDHSCVLTTSALTCWGNDRNAQVSGDRARAKACGNDCRLGPTIVPVAATRVVVGERHTCAIETDGDVVCWGSNEVGQLGHNDAFLVGGISAVLDSAVAIDAVYARTCAIRSDGSAYCWGNYSTTY